MAPRTRAQERIDEHRHHAVEADRRDRAPDGRARRGRPPAPTSTSPDSSASGPSSPTSGAGPTQEASRARAGRPTRSCPRSSRSLDDFDRAIEARPAALAGDAWAEGIAAIDRKLRPLLESEGVRPIDVDRRRTVRPAARTRRSATSPARPARGEIVGEFAARLPGPRPGPAAGPRRRQRRRRRRTRRADRILDRPGRRHRIRRSLDHRPHDPQHRHH